MHFQNRLGRSGTGILAMAACAFLWSIAGLFIKIIDWNPFLIAGLRSLIASLVVLAWLRRPKFTFSGPQLAAAVANASTMLLFVAANKSTTAANAILIQYVAPLLTAFIGAWLLRERPRAEHWAAMPFVAAGLLLMFMDKIGGGSLLGNCLALGSGIGFSLYFVFMRMQKEGSPLESVLLSHWITAAIGLAIAIFLPLPHPTLKSILAIATLGLVQVGFAAILFAAAIKRISAISANLIAVIEPVFNPLWVFMALGEAPGMKALAGGAVILIAVTAASLVTARGRLRENPSRQ
jgi:drug/metabolite transporter (DMT)-like permease